MKGFGRKNLCYEGSAEIIFKLYSKWKLMIDRCYNEKNKQFKDYGGRGISVCGEWLSSVDSFVSWAISSGYSTEFSLDRINNNGDYSPLNCRWTTRTEQVYSRRNSIHLSAFGETKHVVDWAKDDRCQVKAGELWYRLRNGWTPEDAISTPKGKRP